MSVEDPFFVVKGEVEKSVNKCKSLYEKWKEMLNETTNENRNDYDRISNELNNGLRSIEWDLEDLDETIGIVESNPSKFHISVGELDTRKQFISTTRFCIQGMKDELNDPQTKLKADKILRKTLLQNGKSNGTGNYNRYSKLEMASENDNNHFLEDQQMKQQMIINQQDDQLDLVADSVGILKNMSKSIGNELDEQTIMLDGLGNEMENTQNKMDSLLHKMAKVTQLSSDKRQWCAIGILGSSMFLIFLLFFLI